MKISIAKKSGSCAFGGGLITTNSSASTIAKRQATIIIGGSASMATFANTLFTPHVSAIDKSIRKSSGAKAREGVSTLLGYARQRRVASGQAAISSRTCAAIS